MKNVMKYIGKILLAGCMAIAIISVVNVVYSYSGIHIDNETGATDYVWEANQLKTNMSEGYAWLVLDKNGFNNTEEHRRIAEEQGIDILLMGSSHMEAVEVSPTENVGYLLNERIEGKNTYNIGISGHNIYRVIDNAENACKFYKPRDFLVIETDTIELQPESMHAVVSGTAKKIPSYDHGIVYTIQKIPAIKWIYKSLQDWISQSRSNLNMKSKGERLNIIDENNEYRKNLTVFLSEFSDVCKKNDCRAVIFYHPQLSISSYGNVECTTDEALLETFQNCCEKLDILFVDMTETFCINYEENAILPHGFINSYVDRGHLNKHGHKMIAEQLIEVFQENHEEYR